MPAVKFSPEVAALKFIPIRRLVNMCNMGPKSDQIVDGRHLLESLHYADCPEDALRDFYGHRDMGNIQIIDDLSVPDRPFTEEDKMAATEELHNRLVQDETVISRLKEENQALRAGKSSDQQRISQLEAKINYIMGEFGMGDIPAMHDNAPKVKEQVPERFKPPSKTVTKITPPAPPADPSGTVQFSDISKQVAAQAASFEKNLDFSKVPLSQFQREVISHAPRQQVTGELAPVAQSVGPYGVADGSPDALSAASIGKNSLMG